ncbi:hypothetical protein CR205_14245 [Alteribacter lacisalsi]|uniref:Uncharacterized protein n=1 Tax=Alteribacter lacisalsi TaxID=2045244 RepID=A0A2W0H7W7_9BACI|nr:hypothetical protein [Alteribacter lacisalsi]PYZ96836.1 hypothetical protein CR205_14245 [Alteribacter lacisalsi]
MSGQHTETEWELGAQAGYICEVHFADNQAAINEADQGRREAEQRRDDQMTGEQSQISRAEN